jgi:cytochrome c oxidase assembly protein subunit 15
MSGMKASMIYPTWPDIGGEIIPSEMFRSSNWNLESFINYDSGSFTFALMHFIHRGLAYMIVVVFGLYCWRYHSHFNKPAVRSFWIFGGLIVVQILLGIMTLLGSIGHIPVLWGVLHQGVAVFVLSALLYHYYLVRYKIQ